MDNSSHIKQMLDLMQRPAFCVELGQIVAINKAAQQYHIKNGTPIATLISTGLEAYVNYQGGELALELNVEGYALDATVSKIDDCHIFLLQLPNEDEELRGMTLVANDIRRSLSDPMLLVSQLGELQPQLQGRMERSLYQLMRMANNVSDTYRLSTEGADRVQLENVTSLVGEIMEKTQTQLQNTRRSLVFHSEKEPIITAMDTHLISRAIYNLLSNAIKFSPRECTLEATLKTKRDTVYLSITNPMQPQDSLERNSVFGQYRRSPNIADSDAGVGLGITLARKVAIAHGGTLLVEQTDEAMTTTFSMKIRTHASPALRTMIMDFDGGFDNSLIELSDVLPPEAFCNND